MTGKDLNMTTMTKTATATNAANTNILSITFVALLGAAMVFLAGHAQSSVLHDAAHDVRHTAGFPCH
jgi:cobalt transporter subunit CbtB